MHQTTLICTVFVSSPTQNRFIVWGVNVKGSHLFLIQHHLEPFCFPHINLFLYLQSFPYRVFYVCFSFGATHICQTAIWYLKNIREEREKKWQCCILTYKMVCAIYLWYFSLFQSVCRAVQFISITVKLNTL